MGEFLTETKGFTPIIDVLAQEIGLVSAAIYGVVWRYCQQRDGVCQASLETIGEHVGLSARSTIKHMQKLVELGYLEDTTPDLRNHPHTYRDTGAVKIRGLIEATSGMKEVQSSDAGMKNLQSHTEESSEPTMKNLPLKKVESKDTHDGPRAIFVAMLEVCSINYDLMTDKQRGQLNVEGKALRDAGVTPDDVRAFGEWWIGHYWKGRDGQAPRPTQVREDWGRFEAWRQSNGTPGVLKLRVA